MPVVLAVFVVVMVPVGLKPVGFTLVEVFVVVAVGPVVTPVDTLVPVVVAVVYY